MARRWVFAALLLSVTAEAAAPPPAETPERSRIRDEANRLARRAEELFLAGKPAEAVEQLLASLSALEELFPAKLFPEGHPYLATTLNNLGVASSHMGQPRKALAYYEKAEAIEQRLFPRSVYKDGHPSLATNLNNIGTVLYELGEPERALARLQQALEMRQRLFPEGHPELAISLNNVGSVLESLGNLTSALGYHEKALAMRRRFYPESEYRDGHPDVAGSLSNLGHLLDRMGETTRALEYYEQALAMRQKLYPESKYKDGHPELAISLNNMGSLASKLEDHPRALSCYEKALAMRERLYPKARYPAGHPDLALSLSNLASELAEAGRAAEALAYHEKALAMRRRLYPKSRFPAGHADLVGNLLNIGFAMHSQGEPARSLGYYEQALAMSRKLYPEERYRHGHPLLVTCLNHSGHLHMALGEPSRALPLFEKALAMRERLLARVASTGTEAQALNFAESFLLERDFYLTLTRGKRAEEAYSLLWPWRGDLSRVYQRRFQRVHASGDPAARAGLDELTRLRRQRETLLLAPAAGAAAAARNDQLAEIDRREREVLLRLPELRREEALRQAGPADLQKALPPDAVFLDLLRYRHVEAGTTVKKTRKTPHYMAFVVRRGSTERVELGPADPIEAALTAWREGLREGREAGRAAATVRRLVWEPITRGLPPAVRKVYIAPDMALTRLPWAGLPSGEGDRVLLDDFTFFIVPHGPFLLDRLTAPRGKPAAKPTLLAVGDVAYDAPGAETTLAALRDAPVGEGVVWPALAGTAGELDQVRRLAASFDLWPLRGGDATLPALLGGLPAAHFAHLATHGFFADRAFRSALQLDETLFARKALPSGGVVERLGAGARSPMVLSGLVCAGANRPGTPHRGVLTADAVSLLDLRRMELAVLSACETGLGETAGGEGVFGLQRAFHVAGCRNVVASLWRVPDEATAALMARFYTHLWHSGKEVTPAEALRQAQLDVYRNPDRVKGWAAERGPGAKAVVGPAAKPGALTTPPRLWAAWVLSGPGD